MNNVNFSDDLVPFHKVCGCTICNCINANKLVPNPLKYGEYGTTLTNMTTNNWKPDSKLDKNKTSLKDLLNDFVDLLEEEYGPVEGFEVRIDHPIIPDEGKRQGFGTVKEFTLIHLTREQIELK